jgi:hypothetical protein
MSALRKTGSDSCGTTEMVQSSPRVDRKRTFQFGGNYRRAICIIKRPSVLMVGHDVLLLPHFISIMPNHCICLCGRLCGRQYRHFYCLLATCTCALAERPIGAIRRTF